MRHSATTRDRRQSKFPYSSTPTPPSSPRTLPRNSNNKKKVSTAVGCSPPRDTPPPPKETRPAPSPQMQPPPPQTRHFVSCSTSPLREIPNSPKQPAEPVAREKTPLRLEVPAPAVKVESPKQEPKVKHSVSTGTSPPPREIGTQVVLQ